MRREASIPLFLWIATAILAHVIWGGGAEQGARLIDERLDIGRFAAGVRSHVRGSIAPPIEIAIEDDSAPEEAPAEDKPPEPPEEDEATPEDERETPDEVDQKQDRPPKVEPKPEEKKQPEPEPERKPEPKPDEAKPAAPAEPDKAIPQLELPKKIAVKQPDANQKDNPDAAYIADKANKVAEETRARVTSTDQDERKPTPGRAASGPTDEPGNAEETRVRQDNDQAGEPDKAPGGAEAAQAARATAAAPAAEPGKASAASAGKPGSTTSESTPAQAASQDKNQSARAATPEQAGTPEVVASNEGSFSIKRPEAATPEQKARKAKKRLPPRRPRSLMEQLGLGAAGTTGSGVALNLTPNMAASAIGSDELSRMRKNDAERRRSAHRGSWRTPSIERYRSAIENYVPSVKPGNTTALNTAAAPFASYLNHIHSRIHPIFADGFLDSLDRLPASHPMNDPTLITAIEIVVEREEGRLVRRGVVSTSGVTAFDISAIASVDRAGPFGTPPSEIVSPDGNVYLHWEFRRDQMACSTLFAHPFIKRAEPKPAPAPAPAPQPPFRGPDDEVPPNGQRHGRLTPRASPAAPTPPG
ncbi:MAG TPA: hypothetical protein VEX18_10260 [Polyangiaceae bacterium]|nr:hypothetical protein [Polyangiaceae bacterium]